MPDLPKLPTRYNMGFAPDAFETVLSRQSEAQLRAAIESGDIPPRNEARARERLAEMVGIRETEEKAQETAQRAREIEAAERSAKASERSARWAGLAVVVSVAALLLAAWPYLPFSQ